MRSMRRAEYGTRSRRLNRGRGNRSGGGSEGHSKKSTGGWYQKWYLRYQKRPAPWPADDGARSVARAGADEVVIQSACRGRRPGAGCEPWRAAGGGGPGRGWRGLGRSDPRPPSCPDSSDLVHGRGVRAEGVHGGSCGSRRPVTTVS